MDRFISYPEGNGSDASGILIVAKLKIVNQKCRLPSKQFLYEVEAKHVKYIMRKKLKPELNIEGLQDDLLAQAVNEFNRCDNIRAVAKNMGISPMKVRKLLITAGVYKTELSEEIAGLYADGLAIKDIAVILNMSFASVSSYLPYNHSAYKLPDRSVNADSAARARNRKKAKDALKADIQSGNDWSGSDGSLWKVISMYQGVRFRTSGRGKEHIGCVAFSYEIKKSSRTGNYTNELLFSTREQGKSITRSSVELALKDALKVQERDGCVKGPKAIGQIFGISYLYAMFVTWGLITDDK